MKKIKEILIGTILFGTILTQTTTVFAGDFGGGNGGDKVYCQENTQDYEGKIHGHLFLDKLSAYMSGYSNDEMYQSVAEVISNLKTKIPTLAIDLDKMVQAYKAKSRTGAYVWQKVTPTEINDENLFFKIPDHCEGSLKQVVIRTRYNSNRAYFRYNAKQMKNLEKQLSWVFVHELLWDHYNNADEIRLVNTFLHQKDFSELSSSNYILELNSIASRTNFISLAQFNLLSDAKVLLQSLEEEYSIIKNESRKRLLRLKVNNQIDRLNIMIPILEDKTQVFRALTLIQKLSNII